MRRGFTRPVLSSWAIALALVSLVAADWQAPRVVVAARARAAQPETQPAGADGVMQRVQRRYDETANFTASFDQEARIESIGKVLRSNGRVWFEKPGRMRWEYEGSEPQTIVGDGSFLWIEQPRDKQVLRASLREAFQSQTPVSFLLGVGRLDRDFDGRIEARAAGAPSTESLVLTLTPKAAADSPDLGSLTLDVDPVTWDIRAATVRDPLGNRTRLELHDVERNTKIDPARFRYEPPAGMDVLVAPERPVPAPAQSTAP